MSKIDRTFPHFLMNKLVILEKFLSVCVNKDSKF